MSSFKHIEISQTNSCGNIFLNNPGLRNALNGRTLEEIQEGISYFNNKNDVRFVIIRGRGRIFCSGADLNWLKTDDGSTNGGVLAKCMTLARCLQALHEAQKITVCLIHGGSYGGANGLVAACDFAFSTEDALFAFSEVRLGLVPATVSPYVVRKIGLQKAKELMLTGRKFDAADAKTAGLIDDYFTDPGEMETGVSDIIRKLTHGAPEAQQQIRKWLNALPDKQIDESTIVRSAEIIAGSCLSAEAAEGIAAFFENREPHW